MSDQPRDKNQAPTAFLQRWSQRKQAQRVTDQAELNVPEPDGKQTDSAEIREQDLPSVDSLHEDSDIGMFLSEGISESLQRQALRKLFHFGKFNFCDGLDDYAEDYTVFQPLQDLFDIHDGLQRLGDELHPQQLGEQEPEVSVDTDAQTEDSSGPELAADQSETDQES